MPSKNLSSITTSPADRPPIAMYGRRAFADNELTNLDRKIPVILSGALIADTYKDMLTLNSPGVLKFAAIRAENATSRTMGLKITIDGVVALDIGVITSVADKYGMCAAGDYFFTSYCKIASLERVPFNTLTISVKSSLSETDKVALFAIYDLVQP